MVARDDNFFLLFASAALNVFDDIPGLGVCIIFLICFHIPPNPDYDLLLRYPLNISTGCGALLLLYIVRYRWDYRSAGPC